MPTRSKADKRDLGRLLLEREWVEDEQIRLALDRQRQLGGSLSTSLLEIEALSEGRLLSAHADLHGVPAAGTAELGTVPPAVIALLSPREASRYRAVPFAVAGGRADIATDRPEAFDELDELSFLLGKRLAVHVTSEVRLAEALERYFGVRRTARLAELAARLQAPATPAPAAPRATPALPESLPGAVPGPADASRPPAVGGRFRPLTPTVPPDPRRVVALSESERRALSAASSGAPMPAARPLEVDDALMRLPVATSARQVGQLLLVALEPAFEQLVLLRPRQEEWLGWMGRGEGLETWKLESLAIAGSEPSVIEQLSPGRDLWWGELAALPAHRRLVATWGGSLEGSFAAVGVRLGARLLCVGIGKLAPGRIPEADAEAIGRLLEGAAGAFQALLGPGRQVG